MCGLPSQMNLTSRRLYPKIQVSLYTYPPISHLYNPILLSFYTSISVGESSWLTINFTVHVVPICKGRVRITWSLATSFPFDLLSEKQSLLTPFTIGTQCGTPPLTHLMAGSASA